MINTEKKKVLQEVFLEQKLKATVQNKLYYLLIGKQCLPLSYSKPCLVSVPLTNILLLVVWYS